MLLIDVDSSPVVKVIGTVMRKKSPPLLSDTVAVYYIMYRLLRVRLFHFLLFYFLFVGNPLADLTAVANISSPRDLRRRTPMVSPLVAAEN